MDILVQAAIIGVVGGIAGAFVGALVGALGAYVVARMNRAESGRAREDAREALQLDRADARLARFADRKLSLAVDLLLAADEHSRESRQQVASKVERQRLAEEYGADDEDFVVPAVGSTEPVRRAYQAIKLVAPGMADAAGRLYEATLPLGFLASS